MIAEGAWRGLSLDGLVRAGLTVFALAKVLKYWAIAALGPRWTFRVLVPPGAPLVARGPYRWLRHPNYVAVVGELLGVAMAMDAGVTGPIAVAGFGALMLRRIRIEDRALGRGRE
jgi:methyltransferase